MVAANHRRFFWSNIDGNVTEWNQIHSLGQYNGLIEGVLKLRHSAVPTSNFAPPEEQLKFQRSLVAAQPKHWQRRRARQQRASCACSQPTEELCRARSPAGSVDQEARATASIRWVVWLLPFHHTDKLIKIFQQGLYLPEFEFDIERYIGILLRRVPLILSISRRAGRVLYRREGFRRYRY